MGVSVVGGDAELNRDEEEQSAEQQVGLPVPVGGQLGEEQLERPEPASDAEWPDEAESATLEPLKPIARARVRLHESEPAGAEQWRAAGSRSTAVMESKLEQAEAPEELKTPGRAD